LGGARVVPHRGGTHAAARRGHVAAQAGEVVAAEAGRGGQRHRAASQGCVPLAGEGRRETYPTGTELLWCTERSISLLPSPSPCGFKVALPASKTGMRLTGILQTSSASAPTCAGNC